LTIDEVTLSGANMLFADADLDGLPDVWQAAIGGDASRLGDADGDGISNLDAYLASLSDDPNPEPDA
jgi:hypothetical protein